MSRTRGIVNAQADGEGGDRAEQCDGDDEQDQHGDERRAQDADVQRVESVRRGPEDGSGDIRDESQRERAPREDAVHRNGSWVRVRPSAAEKVTERQVDEDQPDDARPDDVARAEHVADQAPGGKFGGKGGHAGDEDGEEDIAFHRVGIIPA